MPIIVNPTAFGQNTLAMKLAFQKANGARGGRRSAAKRKRNGSKKKASVRKSRSSASRSRKTARRSPRKSAHLVKGSPAAKRRMAALRRMRRK